MISVIIPHFDDLINLDRCLALLSEQTVEKGTFEVIVADNNSPCGFMVVEDVCRGRARLVLATQQGAAEARNFGVRASTGEVLAFIDSDCRPDRNWLARGISALERADVVGGRVDVEVMDPQNPLPVECFELAFAFQNKRYIEQLRFSVTANMFVWRSIFEKVGWFRNGVSEDRDWGNRADALGYKWSYEDAAVVSHPARRDWAQLIRKWNRLTRESYEIARARKFGKLGWAVRGLFLLSSPFAHISKIVFSTKLRGKSQKIGAIYILFRIRLWRFRQHYVSLLNG